MKLYLINILVPLLAILPSIIYALFPHKQPAAHVKINAFIAAFEKIGQVAVCVLPLFFPFHFNPILAIGMAIALLFYYIAWARYFVTRKSSFLYQPLLYVPLPLAVFPIIYFFFGALSFNTPIMYMGWALLAIGHLGVTYKNSIYSKSVKTTSRSE